MSPECNPCDENRGEKSTKDTARPETAFAEPMTDHRSERAANTAKHASNKK
jgi:hypothetical protein